MRESFYKINSISSRTYGFEKVVEPQQLASLRFFVFSASTYEESLENINREKFGTLTDSP